MSSIWLDIFASAPERTFRKGATLFHRGDVVQNLHLVRAGTVHLQRALVDGGALTLHRTGPGDVVAMGSLFSETTHCDALCKDTSRVAIQPISIVREWLGASPATMALIEASREVQLLRARIEILRLRRLPDRLDAYLDIEGPPEPGGWVRVAEWIGVTPPALYRELKRRRSC